VSSVPFLRTLHAYVKSWTFRRFIDSAYFNGALSIGLTTFVSIRDAFSQKIPNAVESIRETRERRFALCKILVYEINEIDARVASAESESKKSLLEIVTERERERQG